MNEQKELEIGFLLNRLSEFNEGDFACVVTDESYKILGIGFDNRIHMDPKDRGIFYYALLSGSPPIELYSMFNSWGIQEVVIFGQDIPLNLYDVQVANVRVRSNICESLWKNNGTIKQVAVIQGELAEMITMLSDHFHRGDKEILYDTLTDEIADVELQMDILKLILDRAKKEGDFYGGLKYNRALKYKRMFTRLDESKLT